MLSFETETAPATSACGCGGAGGRIVVDATAGHNRTSARSVA